MMNQTCYILYDSERIPFELQPRKGNIYRVLIKVYYDCRVIVQAPLSASNEEIMNAVKKRARWIYRQRNQFKKQLEHIAPRHYVSGEGHYYLGKQYLLKVVKDLSTKPQIKLLRGKLEIKVKDKSEKNIKVLLFNWYKEKAREVFNQRLDAMLLQTPWINERPQIHLLTTQTQWGSCSASCKLTLNPHLVKASKECIDYVILHELCHIAERNHSDKFYRLMKQIMPNWKIIKQKVDDMANILLNGSKK